MSTSLGSIGFGLMGLTWRPKPYPLEHCFEVLRAAVKHGNVFWNGGDFYGGPDMNSLTLLERYFERYPEDADKVIISVKGGRNPEIGRIDGSPENTARSIDSCIAQLKGRKKLDMFEFARLDRRHSFADTFGFIEREYIKKGKIGGISLSEPTAQGIHEIVQYTTIQAVEVELSMFATEPLHNGVAAACAKYHIPLVAYSPIGRGMLSGKWKTVKDIPGDSLLLSMNFPRFRQENFEINRRLAEKVEKLAEAKGCSTAQLAINWTRSLSRRLGMPVIVPIPGSTTVARVEENSKLVEISDEEMAQIDAILADFTPAGTRYP